MKLKLDHFYYSVSNMDRAVEFYEELLDTPVKHREKNQWADFDLGNGVYFGLIGDYVIEEERKIGNNSTLVLVTSEIEKVYKKLTDKKVAIIDELTKTDYTDYSYKYFTILDTEGNRIEIADYDDESRK